MSRLDPIERTKRWIEEFVIQYNLCPFAAHPFQKGKIRYCLVESVELEDPPAGRTGLAKALIKEVQLLASVPSEEIETTLIIHPNILTDFLDFNYFLAVAESILEEMELDGVIQIASFHPQYQYADASPNSAANYVTRSPFPMLHLLREESVAHAIKSHSDTTQIPEENIKKMEALGLKQLKLILSLS